jgi:hypothetical protein
MGRRRFDHLVTELSVAAAVRVPRFPLWLTLRELGADPEDLTRDQAVAFCGTPLTRFLREQGLVLQPRTRRRLERAVSRYDPAIPSPYERMARL